MSSSKFSVPRHLQDEIKRCPRTDAYLFDVKIETGNPRSWTVVRVAVFFDGRARIACANESRLGLFNEISTDWDLVEPARDIWLSIEEELERFAIALACKARSLFRENIVVTFKDGSRIKKVRVREVKGKGRKFKIV